MGQHAISWASAAALARRAAVARHAPMVTAGVLAVAALAQASWAAASASPGSPGGELASVVASDGLLAPVVVALPCLVATLPLGARWRQPATAAVTVCAASIASLVFFDFLTWAALAAQVIVAYRAGRRGPPLLAAGLAVPFLTLAFVPLLHPGSGPVAAAAWPSAHVMAILAATLGPMAACAGAAWRFRSMSEEHTAAAEAIADSLLENTARGERARISRELHDVVAHHISMIAVQAETARLATPGMPAAGAQRLTAIGDTARAALTEMRRLLGVLREDTGPPAASREPQPSLAQLNELLDETRDASGICARLIIRGWLTTLDPGVELAAYRIVQEALTNARRHAPGAAVDVELHYTHDTLELRIRDNGPGPPTLVAEPKPTGHGLLGMRERAAAVGGELRTGAAPGGGFLVQATLPAKAEELLT